MKCVNCIGVCDSVTWVISVTIVSNSSSPVLFFDHADPEPIVILSSTSGIFSFNTRTRAFGSVASINGSVSAMTYDTPNRVRQQRLHGTLSSI